MTKKLTKLYEKFWKARTWLYLHNFVTESENHKIIARINKWAVKEDLKE